MINQCVFFDRMMTCDECDEFNLQGCGGVAVGWSIRLACGRLGVRIPAATKTKSLKQVVTAPMPNVWHQVWVSRVLGDDHFKPVSLYVWYAKEPLLLNA